MLSGASHYKDVIMGAMASQITSLTIVYSFVYSGPDQAKHQSSASLAFVRRIHRWLVNSPHKGPVMWKRFPFDDIIMCYEWFFYFNKCLWAINLNFPNFQKLFMKYLQVVSPHSPSLHNLSLFIHIVLYESFQIVTYPTEAWAKWQLCR